MAKALDPREHYVRSAVSNVHRSVEFLLHRAFEEAGCSCAPLRRRLAELQEECSALEGEFKDNHPAFQEMERVHAEILATDRAEHPALNQLARTAGPFFRLWLYDELKAGHVLEDFAGEKLAAAYAQAWSDGWRPRLFQEELEVTCGQ